MGAESARCVGLLLGLCAGDRNGGPQRMALRVAEAFAETLTLEPWDLVDVDVVCLGKSGQRLWIITRLFGDPYTVASSSTVIVKTYIYLLYVHVLQCTWKRGKYQPVQHDMWNRIKHRNLFPLPEPENWCREVLAHWSVDTFVGVACDFLHQRVWHCLLSMILPMIRGSFSKRLAGLCFSTFFALVECGLLYHDVPCMHGL